MQLYGITDSFEEGFWGPYTDPELADKVLRIVQISIDEEAEIVTAEADQYADQLRAGLLPFKISVTLLNGVVQDTEVTLIWPPAPSEGIVRQREDYIEYFAWARGQGEAKVKIVTLPKRSVTSQGKDR